MFMSDANWIFFCSSSSHTIFACTGKMFSSHKPRVYRSSSGCCICGSKSSSSRFTSSEKYERDFAGCFEIQQGSRSGLMCNACVLLVKRWQKLPEGSKRSWSHAVDGKTKSRRNSRRSSSNAEEEASMTESSPVVDFDQSVVKRTDISSQAQGGRQDYSDFSPPLPCSPTPSEISDCAISDDGRISTACQTSFFFPQLDQSEMKVPYIDLSGWRREEVCCGTIFKGPNGEVLVDPKLLKPYCHCARSQNRKLVKQSSEES